MSALVPETEIKKCLKECSTGYNIPVAPVNRNDPFKPAAPAKRNKPYKPVTPENRHGLHKPVPGTEKEKEKKKPNVRLGPEFL